MKRCPSDALQKQHASVGEFELRLDNNTLWLCLLRRRVMCRHSAVESGSSAPLMFIFLRVDPGAGAIAGNDVSAWSIYIIGTHIPLVY